MEKARSSLPMLRLLAQMVYISEQKHVTVTPAMITRREPFAQLKVNSPTNTEQMTAEWVNDQNTMPSEKVILFLHGGGYICSSAESHRNFSISLAKTSNCKVLAVNYRLAPEYPFPYPLMDAISAYLHLVDPSDPTQTKYLPENVIIMGDSAGGGLAISLALWLRQEKYCHGKPGAVIALSPWVSNK
jgi:monoterpene epsilon-lactone hydrolase